MPVCSIGSFKGLGTNWSSKHISLSNQPQSAQGQCGLQNILHHLWSQGLSVPVLLQDRFKAFYSMFMVSNINRGNCPILDLKSLNKYLKIPKFGIESARPMFAFLRRARFLASVDIPDAYLHISI